MAAYVIVQETIHDPDTFATYAAQAPATLEGTGAKMLVRGGELTKLEGDWPHNLVVVIEFPSRDVAEGWYHSEAYSAIRPLRHKSAVSNFVIVDGV
jgi:uncharacterized protein (DUF1330 family)